MNKVEKRGYISATVIKDSISPQGNRITTFELEYPRFIHSEFMTHREFSRNSASSRAIPVAKMHEHILKTPQGPIHWGSNKPGMQAGAELTGYPLDSAKAVWDFARESAVEYSRQLNELGLHKQVANRLTEPFMQMKVVCTATNYSNFFWLRLHRDAQPEIQELANAMWQAYVGNVPDLVKPGEWHLPYVDLVHGDGKRSWYEVSGVEVDLDTAIKVSASCCAQVSYRRLDDSIEKAIDIYNRLINSVPVHASPVEHQATPVLAHKNPLEYLQIPGVTHIDSDLVPCSGNFKNWIQQRQLVKNHNCKDYFHDSN